MLANKVKTFLELKKPSVVQTSAQLNSLLGIFPQEIIICQRCARI